MASHLRPRLYKRRALITELYRQNLVERRGLEPRSGCLQGIRVTQGTRPKKLCVFILHKT